MVLYFPGLTGVLAVIVTWGIGAVLLLIGSGVSGTQTAAEFRIVAGWGVLCVVLTAWGVFMPAASLRWPVIAVVLAAFAHSACAGAGGWTVPTPSPSDACCW